MEKEKKADWIIGIKKQSARIESSREALKKR